MRPFEPIRLTIRSGSRKSRSRWPRPCSPASRLPEARPIGQATQGVRRIEIDEDDRVVLLARFAERDAEGCVEPGDRSPCLTRKYQKP